MRTLVTGATGFVGRHVCMRLAQDGHVVRQTSRTIVPGVAASDEALRCDLESAAELESLVAGCESIVHLAARVHVMSDSPRQSVAAYESANARATERLAAAASRVGVKRFVYLSSIKVNGESTSLDRPFRHDDTPRPVDAYAESKLNAENRLREIAARTSLETVVIRPPLVYGPGVRANFESLVKLVRSGLPLPFAAVQNRRSMIAVANLTDSISASLSSTRASGHTLLVSDDQDLSLPQLISLIANGLGRRPRLFRLPQTLVVAMLQAVAQGAAADRLLGSLLVDIEHTKEVLGWAPKVSVRDAVKATVEAIA